MPALNERSPAGAGLGVGILFAPLLWRGVQAGRGDRVPATPALPGCRWEACAPRRVGCQMTVI